MRLSWPAPAREAALLLRLARRHSGGRPVRVTAILTERCHLRCGFCRLWEQPDPGVALGEWLTFFRRNPFLRWVNLSGGELFAKEGLRRFLPDLVQALPRLLLLDFPTAGQRPREVEAAVDLLRRTRLPRLVVTVSLDGGPALHDRLRGVDGAFERAFETFARLRGRQDRRFQVRVGCTLTDAAVRQVESLRAELRLRLPDLREGELHYNLAHHSGHYYRNRGFQGLPAAAAVELLRRRPLRADPVGWAEWVYGRLARRALQEGFPPVGCEAIRHTVFVGPDLTVYPCSIWDRPLGRLRDVDYELPRLLEGDAARAARAGIDRRACPGCFTPCEAVPAMLAHPVRATLRAVRG